MHVIILNDYAVANGGSSVVALSSALGLARQGVKVTLFTAVKGDEKQMIKSESNLTVINLGQEEIVKDPHRFRAFRNGIANREAANALLEVLSKCDKKETVIHVHTYTKALSPLALAIPLETGFKTILSLHDFFISCPTGGFFVNNESKICTRRPLSMSCLTCSCDRRSYAQKLWRSARTFYQNQVLSIDRRMTLFLGISELSVKVLKPYLPQNVPIQMLRNPVDFAYAEPAPVADNAPFVFIGRFSTEKGPLLFAEAVRRLKMPAVFIGDGELMQAAKEICPEATFTGWLPAAEVKSWLRRARALVFPPLWYETLGLVVLEAAANGVPAIVADQSAATDFIKHQENGLHFEHGSVDSLCDQMQRLQDASYATKLGAAAHQWYWDDPWTLEKHVAELVQIYQRQLCAESSL